MVLSGGWVVERKIPGAHCKNQAIHSGKRTLQADYQNINIDKRYAH
jgi:hypothetical protein